MIKKRTLYNISCDYCGCLLDSMWHGQTDTLQAILDGCGWKELEGRHYCGDCWKYDDDDQIVTRDGCRFTSDGKLVPEYRMNYMEVGEWMTLTQFRLEISKTFAVYQSMVGTLYKSMLDDDLQKAGAWLRELTQKRRGTPEWECYYTFMIHGIFDRMLDDSIERMYNHQK